jgi:hypothetical protein
MIKDLFKIYYIYFYKILQLRFTNKPIILGRVACLGIEIAKRLNVNYELVNHQKSRIDSIINSNFFKNPFFFSIYRRLIRKDIAFMILSQKHNLLKYQNPKFILIDSNSELNDHLFVADNKYFYSNYFDVNHYKLKPYKHKGLIDLNDLENSYKLFFDLLHKRYYNINILFLHYPVFKEKRHKIVERGNHIKYIINKIAETDKYLHSIYIDENKFLNTLQEDDFQYHYNIDVYDEFERLTKNILLNNKIVTNE